MKFLTTFVQDVYHESVVLKVLAILFHNGHFFIFRSKIPAVNGGIGKFQTAQEPITSLDFTFWIARKNSPIIKLLIVFRTGSYQIPLSDWLTTNERSV